MPLLTTVMQGAGPITVVKTDEDFDLTSISGRIKWGRARLGLSQPQLAKKAGMKPADAHSDL